MPRIQHRKMCIRDRPDGESNCVAFRLKDADSDPQELRSALSYSYTSKYEDHTYERCDYKLKEYGRLQKNSTTAIFVIGALYIAVVFIFMAMAILALKTLSGITEDRLSLIHI